MTKIYRIPLVEVHPIAPLSMICESGDSQSRVSGIVSGGDNEGDVTAAF